MSLSLQQILLLVLDIAWRRRYLLIAPFITILPLGILFTQFGPRPYVAKCLLLLQENSRLDPLSRQQQAITNMHDRINGLRALLTSDRVLHTVMLDLTGDKAPTDAKEAALFRKNLSDALTLELIGSDFLQLQMKATSPKDLGKKLEAVVSRFIESLLPAQDVHSAMQVLIDRRREEMEAAERDLARFRVELGASFEDILQRETALFADMKARTDQAAATLVELSRSIVALRQQLDPGKAGTGKAGDPSADRKTSQAATDAAQAADGRDLAAQLREAEAKYLALEKEVRQLTQGTDVQQRKVRELTGQEFRLRELASDATKARDNFQTLTKRIRAPAAAGTAPQILNAPERIRLIDLPRDPVFPATSAMKIILATIAASLVAAAGLVALAELLDSKVRRESQFESITGLPVLARLPASRDGGAAAA